MEIQYRIFKYVNMHIRYEIKNEKTGAVNLNKGGRGVCDGRTLFSRIHDIRRRAQELEDQSALYARTQPRGSIEGTFVVNNDVQ